LRQRRLNKEDLAARYPDREWRERFELIASCIEFFENCILRPDYRIPDDLNNGVVLTSFGASISQALITREHVPPKEAKVICFLTLGHVELLVDIEKSNVDLIQQSLHRQVLDGDLLFPLVFGRDLYDRAAELFEDERAYLNFEDTIRLIENFPVGVFQVGTMLIGPYGLVRSPQRRWLPPTRLVPLFHCSELTCNMVHRCRLSSNRSVPIFEHWPKIHKLLEAEGNEPSAWSAFLADIVESDVEAFNPDSPVTLPYLLGDSLSVGELRRLVVGLLDTTQGEMREVCAPLGIRGKAEDAVANMSRAELLQLILLARDETIRGLLDALVAGHEIVVPPGEVRTPMVNSGYRSGKFELGSELGRYGYRLRSAGSQIGPLRLRRLVDRLYTLDEGSDISELEWQLRGVEASTLPARLEEYVRTSTPEEVLKRLVLARRTNMITACTELGIDEHRSISDDDLVNSLLWKLGFELNDDCDANGRFWQLHEKMKQVTHTAGISALVDQEAVRALASNYFVLLEELLDDSLAFVTWALTTDHAAAPRPYSYRVEKDRLTAFERLTQAEVERDSGQEVIRFGDKNSLFELCRGFGILASYLDVIRNDADRLLRSESTWPLFAKHSDLKRFPLRHLVPFLDLLEHSKDAVISELKETSRTLVAADVNGVRNDQLHFRRSTADLDRLSKCLAAVEDAVSRLEKAGFTRLLFHLVSEQGDRWDRKIYILSDPRGREIAFARPSSYDWLGLPGLGKRQYLVTSAVLGEPNEILRFRPSINSDFATLWENYPKRRAGGSVGMIRVEGDSSASSVTSQSSSD
jgi:hypothetical protein